MRLSNFSPDIQVIASGLDFPEGPVFDKDEKLWFVESNGGQLCRLTNSELLRVPVGGAPNGMTVDDQNRLWFCDSAQNAIRRYSINKSQWDTIITEADSQPLNRPNDLAFDREGNILFTCPGNSRYEPTGYVCAASPKGQVTKIATNMFFPNGLAFTDNGEILIIAETYKHRLWKGKWDSKNYKLTEFKPWIQIGGPIGPDGMAFDIEGNLYVAIFDKSCLKVVSKKGKIIHEIKLIGSRPTNCAFVPGRCCLVVTEAERGEILQFETKYLGAKLFESSSLWE